MLGCSHSVYLCGYMGASLAYKVEDTGNLCPWLLRAARSGAQDRNSCAWLYFFKKKCLCQLLILKTLKHIENLQEECSGHSYTLCPDSSF